MASTSQTGILSKLLQKASTGHKIAEAKYEPPCKASCLVPWVSYYFFTQTEYPETVEFPNCYGFVTCPLCTEHFSGDQLLRHILLHLLTNELSLGTCLPYEYCSECLSSTTSPAYGPHRQIHWHITNNDPANLLNGSFVCPICEVSFTTIIKFAIHLYEKHVFRDSPYVCPICFNFRTSRHCDLLKHLRSEHRQTNHIFCPYCLRYFDLPPRFISSESKANIFTAQNFYTHVRRHWDDKTYRCESCRLDFIHRRDYRLHEYWYHSGYPHYNFPAPPKPGQLCRDIDFIDPRSTASASTTEESSSQLYLYYSHQLRIQVPRAGLKCLECGENLRQPITRHFGLMVRCTGCRFASSCLAAVNWHWCHVHSAPPIPPPAFSGGELRSSWESSINSMSTFRGASAAAKFQHSQPRSPEHDPCGSMLTRYRRQCKEKHAPPGMESCALLRCSVCGFRTILGNQMARHLALSSRCDSSLLDYSPRIALFRIRRSPFLLTKHPTKSSSRLLRLRAAWVRQLKMAPDLLQSVGLCSAPSYSSHVDR